MALASQLSAATKLARSTIYQWCHENYVPHLKLGDSIRFRPADVMTSLDANSKPGWMQRVPAVEV
jgi:excisionase family DNA binding protein